MDNRNIEHRVNSADLEKKVDVLTKKVDALTASIEDLLLAWNASRGLLTMIKWLAGLGAAVAVIWATWNGHR